VASGQDLKVLKAMLEQLKSSLIRRIHPAAVKSPERLGDELSMLDTVLELEAKFMKQA